MPALFTLARRILTLEAFAEPEAAGSHRNDADDATGMSDIVSRIWYIAAANWTVANKVINGFPQGDGLFSFEPDISVTMSQLCTIIANNMWDYENVLHLPLSMRQRGDVISWEGHVAIYLGDDMIIDAYGPVGVHDMWSRGVPRGVLRFYQ